MTIKTVNCHFVAVFSQCFCRDSSVILAIFSNTRRDFVQFCRDFPLSLLISAGHYRLSWKTMDTGPACHIKCLFSSQLSPDYSLVTQSSWVQETCVGFYTAAVKLASIWMLVWRHTSKARFPLPELTAQVDRWPVSITCLHGPCWRAPGFH